MTVCLLLNIILIQNRKLDIKIYCFIVKCQHPNHPSTPLAMVNAIVGGGT